MRTPYLQAHSKILAERSVSPGPEPLNLEQDVACSVRLNKHFFKMNDIIGVGEIAQHLTAPVVPPEVSGSIPSTSKTDHEYL